VIEIHDVTKRFYSLVALNNVSLTIPAGEVVGILGPNGAGKTTLFKLIAGFLNPDQGYIRPSYGSWPLIGYKPERLLYPNTMRVGQYLRLIAGLSNIPGGEIDQVVKDSLTRVNLSEAAGKFIRDCSKGMRQRIGLAQSLIGEPPLLLLDEPSNGLDPEGQADICERIQQLHAAGKTIVLSSHQLSEVTQVCTRLFIISQGTVLYENTMAAALAEQPRVQIRVDHELEPVSELLCSLHPDIQVDGINVTLHNEAMQMRRQILSLLLATGYDILHVEQQRTTLAQVYAEAVK
jgi:ABC-2 type transport system ATP-binding protein